MRIAAISDIHGWLPDPAKMPDADVLVIAGDLCNGRHAGEQAAWMRRTFAAWAEALRIPRIVATWGNHDFVGSRVDAHLPIPKTTWLVDEACTVDGVRFWGTPRSLPFGHWTYMAEEDEIADRLAYMPDDTDVVLCHGAPKGIGDRNSHGLHTGSEAFRKRLEQAKPSLVVFGHIHESWGRWERPGTIYANVAWLDIQYRRRPEGEAGIPVFEVASGGRTRVKEDRP